MGMEDIVEFDELFFKIMR